MPMNPFTRKDCRHRSRQTGRLKRPTGAVTAAAEPTRTSRVTTFGRAAASSMARDVPKLWPTTKHFPFMNLGKGVGGDRIVKGGEKRREDPSRYIVRVYRK